MTISGLPSKNLEKSLHHWRELFDLHDHGIEKIEEHGVKIVRLDGDEGAEGNLAVFIYPGCFNGVLIELKEEKKTEPV